jgi:hypothetical protein
MTEPDHFEVPLEKSGNDEFHPSVDAEYKLDTPLAQQLASYNEEIFPADNERRA